MISDFFFFKQKTAYEMRISDWSSDVCSSDLSTPPPTQPPWMAASTGTRQRSITAKVSCISATARRICSPTRPRSPCSMSPAILPNAARSSPPVKCLPVEAITRSEEHTSELQSLMRISYAVFCLTKKKIQKHKKYHKK